MWFLAILSGAAQLAVLVVYRYSTHTWCHGPGMHDLCLILLRLLQNVCYTLWCRAALCCSGLGASVRGWQRAQRSSCDWHLLRGGVNSTQHSLPPA
jgi:hypothetical protein